MDKEYLIKKWLNNTLSETEAKAFQALEDNALYEEIIKEAQRFDATHHTKVEPFEAIESLLDSKKSTTTNWLKIVSGIAAVLIIGVALLTFFNRDNIYTFHTGLAENETITLPDNSIVKLNQLSQLEYKSSNWDKNRVVELKGEAFFDVEKGKQFDVHTNFGNVRVLGTEFNVISTDSVFKVSCYEGLVKVSYGKEEIKLPAGTEITVRLGISEQTNIVITGPNWLNNMSVFKNASIDIVIKEFEKHYNINVLQEFDDNGLKFTGAFEHTDLENALKSITQPLNLTYDFTNDKTVTIRNVKD